MNLKKTLIAAAAVSLLGGAVLSVASSSRNNSDDLFKANVEALADGENSPGEIVRKFLGCPGGERICFSGTITIGGVKIEGTFYLE